MQEERSCEEEEENKSQHSCRNQLKEEEESQRWVWSFINGLSQLVGPISYKT